MNEAETYKSFLEKVHSGEWTLDEMDKECAFWFIHTVYDPLPIPEPPKELKEYEVLTTKEKESLPPRFWHSPAVSGYRAKRDHAVSYNKGILDSLIRFKGYLPEKDDHSHQLYRDKIKLFSNRPPEVEKVTEMFGGRVV